MEAPEQVYGVTPPMKTDLPTDAERRTTDALLEELKRQNTFESPADTAKRYITPGLLSIPSPVWNVLR
jgi:poly(A) polymerase